MISLEADVEAVREEQSVARVEVRRDLRFVDPGLLGVGQEDHDHVGLGGRIGDREHPQPGFLGLAARGRALAQTDPHVDAGLGQVQRVARDPGSRSR